MNYAVLQYTAFRGRNYKNADTHNTTISKGDSGRL